MNKPNWKLQIWDLQNTFSQLSVFCWELFKYLFSCSMFLQNNMSKMASNTCYTSYILLKVFFMLNIKRLWLTFTTTHTIIILLNFCTIAIMIPIQTSWQGIEISSQHQKSQLLRWEKLYLWKTLPMGIICAYTNGFYDKKIYQQKLLSFL